jgi:hypothetical protein
MKTIYKSLTKIVFPVVALAALALLPACNDNPDAFELTDGVPVVHYVRIPDAVSADSLITSAFMGKTIALVGENLTSVKEIWFNDQKTVINTSLITPTALITSVPTVIPKVVTNKMYLITQNSDTVKVDFKVDVPAPLVSNMKCEFAADGEVAVIRGNYFLSVADSENPNVIFTPNIKATEVVSYSLNEIQVKVPAGAQPGPVSVESRYGTTRSKFWFRDNRGMILDWDNLNANGGWRSGVTSDSDPVAGITGKYVRFKGAMTADPSATWNEDAFSFNLWGTSNGRPEGDLFSIAPAEAVIKFEINVTQAWKAGALQMIFTPWSTANTNSYLADGTTPRGLWIPWKATGSYTTDGWETITLPIKDFKYNQEGVGVDFRGAGNYGGLTFFLWHGGAQAKGEDCTPEICIDNIRVVPAE